jgi:GNAT superfamily N-acetyltransferase
VGGGLRDLAAIYGWIGTLWRLPILALLERDVKPGILLMDGIFATTAARGKGVGTLLLQSNKAEAKRRDAHSVRLDVIDSNPRARALYERQGFVAQDTHSIGPLRHLFGFSKATTMVFHPSASEPGT